MKSTEKLNQSIYEELSKKFGIDKRICEHIMRCQFKLVKEEIERPDCWGDVTLYFFGTFSLVKSQREKTADFPVVKLTDEIDPKKRKYAKRSKNQGTEGTRAVQDAVEPG